MRRLVVRLAQRQSTLARTKPGAPLLASQNNNSKKSNTVRSTVSTGTKDEAEPPGDAQLRALEVYPAAFRSRYTLTHSSVVCSLTTKQRTEQTCYSVWNKPKMSFTHHHHQCQELIKQDWIWHVRTQRNNVLCPWDNWPGYNINEVLYFSSYKETTVWALNMSLEHFKKKVQPGQTLPSQQSCGC